MILLKIFKEWFNKSIKHKLIFSSISTTIIFIFLLGFFSFYIVKKNVNIHVNERNRQIALLSSNYINTQFNDIWNDIILLASHLLVLENNLNIQANEMLGLIKTYPFIYRSLYLFEENGKLLIYFNEKMRDLEIIGKDDKFPDPSPDLFNENVYEAFLKANKDVFFCSDVFILGPEKMPVIFMGIPIINQKKEIKQVIVAEIDLRDMWRIIDKIWIGQTGRASIISKYGIILAHSDRSYIGKIIEPELKDILTGYEGEIVYKDINNGKLMIAAFSPIGKLSGWGIIIEQEYSEAFSSINNIFSITFIFLLIATFISVIVSILIAQNITNPIEFLEKTTKKITKTGNLNHNVIINRKDEIGKLSINFNRMILSLLQAREEIISLNNELSDRVYERTRELEESIKDLESFNYSVSHDLRTPLRSIDGFSLALLKRYSDMLDDEGKDYLNRIRNSSQLMGKLIDDLLSLSKITRYEIQYQTIDLSKMVKSILDDIKKNNPERKIDIIIHKVPDVESDQNMLNIVLNNLIINAWKFTGKKSNPKIEFGYARVRDEVVYFIKDNGAGFDMAYADKLFGAFQRLHTHKEFPGTGIGLAIVKRIFNRLAGRIWADAKEGKGATFYFVLPKKNK